jgi:hypothetical protein
MRFDMKTKYSNCNVLSIRLEPEQISDINEIALSLGLPRNTVIRRLFTMILADLKKGRRIFNDQIYEPNEENS